MDVFSCICSFHKPSSSLKRNSGDIGWDYGVLVDPNNLNVIKCKFCDLVVRAGIYRLKQHVGGIRGEVRPCLKASPEAIDKCKKAVDDSKQAKKARQEEKQDVRDVVILDDGPDVEDTTINGEGLDDVGDSTQRKLGPMDKFTLPMDSSSLSNTKLVRQQRITEALWKERMHALKRYIARWVYVHGIPFHAINNEEFDQLLEAAGRFGPGGQKPNQHELREKLLYEEVEDTKKLLKLQEQEWAKNGCSIMTDAWTDQKRRSIMNMCVNCSIGTTFLESKEASAESRTGEFIFQYVDSCIEKIGAEKVVQVVTDNASNNMAAKALLSVKRPNIFWSSCATHTLNLMLEGIGKLKRFKTIIDQAKALTIFIYAHHKTLALMRKFTKKRDIIRPGVTRFASSFLTLQSLYEKKNELRAMSQSEEWETISHVKKTPKVFEPLVKVLRMVDGDVKPSMAFLYGDILKAKKEIMVGLGNIDKAGTLNLYNNIIEIIDEKMKGRLDSPLHLVAYFLNPYYSYNDSSIFGEEEVMDGFFTAVETFYHGDYDKQNQVLNEDLHKFKYQTGHFAKPAAMAGCKDYNFFPVPQTVKENWSCFDGVHTKKRNRLTCERVEQLVYVRFNNLHSKKKAKAKKNNKVDPLVAANATCAQGWMVDGGDDDNSDVDAVTGLTWQQIVDTCGTEEVTKLRRSARLAHPRQIEEDVQSEPEELPNEEEEIEFESDQEEVVTTGYEQDHDTANDD
ncbi:unnamed protein product [Miscanthus lutarioriparius]|uniref:DUF659 domain-containing protein n=1 Tax=Miscanthus lutarioriparius TaxID=422564 RepID=A0A811QDD0_9POAL|nr:unnamed protein product [Miscanthus lutarioriparius]